MFPYHDSNWVSVVSFLDSISKRDDLIVSPIEFIQERDYYNSYYIKNIDFDMLSFCIVHKGRLLEIGIPLLDYCINNGIYVYGNDVFVIFSFRREMDRNIKKEPDVHLRAFFENYERIRKYIKKNSSTKNAKKRKINIGILSANKMGNVGDDLVTLMSKELFLRSCKEIGIPCSVHVNAPPIDFADILKYDILCLGGGGLIYDTDFNNVSNYMQPLKFAAENKIATCAMGVGVQGVRTAIGREIYKSVLSMLEFVTVRDPFDFDFMKKVLGLENAFLACDMAFYIKEFYHDKISFNRSGLENNDKVVSLALTDTTKIPEAKIYKNYEKTLPSLLEYLSSKYQIINLLVHSRDDINLYNRIYKSENCTNINIIELDKKTVSEVIDIYIKSNLVICTRYHSLILSLVTNTPFICSGSHNNKQQRLINNYFPSLRDRFLIITDFSLQNIRNILDNNKNSPSLQSSEIEKIRKLLSVTTEKVYSLLNKVISRNFDAG